MIARVIVLIAIILCLAIGVAAKTAKTYVAPTRGNDSGACTKSSPCKTIAVALRNTKDGGTVILLEAREDGAKCAFFYDNPTITQSVTIKPARGLASKPCFKPTAASQDAFLINGANINVKLRSLKVAESGGFVGVSFVQGASLEISDFDMTSLNHGIIQQDGKSLVVRKSKIESSMSLWMEDNRTVDRTAMLDSVKMPGNVGRGHYAILVGTRANLVLRDSEITGSSKTAIFVTGGAKLKDVTIAHSQDFISGPGRFELVNVRADDELPFPSGINGRVTDQNGSVIANARVVITQRSDHSMRQLGTDDNGEYEADLRADTYDFEVSKDGFKTAVRKGIRAAGDGRRYVDFVLEVK
jgi:hypothetical protein